MEATMTLEKLKNTVKVGTEFTFRNTKDNNFKFKCSLPDLESKKKIGLITNNYILKWAKKLKENEGRTLTWPVLDNKKLKMCDLVMNNITVRDLKMSRNCKNYLGLIEINMHFLLTKRSILSLPEKLDWTFFIDIDTMCIELQTQPLTYNEFKILQPAIDQLIFGFAKELKLEADKNEITGGGGHISLDKATAFGTDNSGIHLRNFIVAYFNEASKKTSWVTQCKDIINAPFIDELSSTEISSFKNLIVDFDNLPNENKTIYQLATAINTFYKNTKKGRLEAVLGKVTQDDLIHYQAINLEHMEAVDGQARIEMRRFNAQANTGELLADLDNLYGLLLESWKDNSDIKMI